ncbi:hypothetical protein DIPPA_01972 [Diplonema papillatum]|nr:hypothetical protein DIPPA_01972 [Diplonema papillatum]
MNRCTKCCNYLLSPYLKRLENPEDDEIQRGRKAIVPHVVLFLMLISLFSLAVTVKSGGIMYTVLSLIVVVVYTTGFAHITVVRSVTDGCLLWMIAGSCVTALGIDFLGVATNNFRPWALIVLLVDCVIVCRMKRSISTALVGVGVLWLFFTNFESAFRFGAYELLQTDRDEVIRMCTCEHPPCAIGVAAGANMFFIMCTVFVADFLFTRNFADQVLEEREAMQRSVTAAETIATHLASFSLGEADTSLDALAESIPQELYVALYKLLGNLRAYEPFLPQSVLPFGELDNDPDSASSSPTSGAIKSPGTKSLGSKSISLTASRTQSLSHSARSASTLHDGPTTQIHSLVAVKSTDVSLRAVTLLAVNLADSLSLVGKSKNPQAFRDAQRTLLNASLRAAQEARGLVESFMGDRITSSWNASRTCVAHRDRAVSAACAVTEAMRTSTSRVTVHCAVASGEAWCGNMGTETFMRYNFVGAVYSFAHDLVRVATDWRMPILIDSRVQRDVAMSYTTRVVLEPVVFPKRGDEKLTVLWEVTGANTGDLGEEWMYVVDSDDMRRNQQLNQLALAYLQNNEESFAEILPELHVQKRGVPSPLGDRRLERFLSYVRSPLPPCQRLPHRTDRFFPFSEEELGSKQTASPRIYLNTSESP